MAWSTSINIFKLPAVYETVSRNATTGTSLELDSLSQRISANDLFWAQHTSIGTCYAATSSKNAYLLG